MSDTTLPFSLAEGNETNPPQPGLGPDRQLYIENQALNLS